MLLFLMLRRLQLLELQIRLLQFLLQFAEATYNIQTSSDSSSITNIVVAGVRIEGAVDGISGGTIYPLALQNASTNPLIITATNNSNGNHLYTENMTENCGSPLLLCPKLVLEMKISNLKLRNLYRFPYQGHSPHPNFSTPAVQPAHSLLAVSGHEAHYGRANKNQRPLIGISRLVHSLFLDLRIP